MKLKVGETLILEELNNQKQIIRYRCKIAEIRENALLIDYPIEEKTGKSPVLLNGTSFTAIYVVDNQVFRFLTTFVCRISGQVPVMLMSFEGEDKMEEIQRRNYVRVETNVDIAVHSLTQAFRPFATLTSDIGGGGALILLPEKSEIGEEDLIEVWISLPMASATYQYVKLKGKVIRVFTDKHTNGMRATIAFITQTERDRQPIIRFCFEKQLESRKKLLEMESRKHS
ncbi:flagellar brake protein [Sporolactobacillus nakayamae]|uniref:C-di-GMP-binding flagellar brake protein YcgR, contains PilZNR and PilZ domains n=1 Tax=Sporolactobacillus nakayamae TaxID=269670 RepID=A0A1I2MUI5_9BACL|nr:flagellar brake domain-containing protein [Sporolactobacillus nakayamae]SFF95204.1 c-di-GMP-binding flagellar brake protein YcgR, contains PilZNR and PilZ domains [Sporolactobacillus nakayamae]